MFQDLIYLRKVFVLNQKSKHLVLEQIPKEMSHISPKSRKV